MPFSEKTHVLHAVDCTNATAQDRVRAELNDGSYVVLRTRPELTDELEREDHVRLHLDRTLTPSTVVEAFEKMAFPVLTHYLQRKLKQRAMPSMIGFFCWADNYEFWTGGPNAFGQKRFELVAWLQIPGEPVNYFPNGPFHLDTSLIGVEFFTV